jgi:transposase
LYMPNGVITGCGGSRKTGSLAAVDAYSKPTTGEIVAKWVSESLWELAAPLIRERQTGGHGGARRRVDDRRILAVILYMTQTDCPWWKLPEATFGVTRTTAHRRFVEWNAAGLWEQLRQAVVDQLDTRAGVDWSRTTIDSIAALAERAELTALLPAAKHPRPPPLALVAGRVQPAVVVPVEVFEGG